MMARAKDKALSGYPVGGMGPGGIYTLWLPNDKPTIRYRFVDGHARRQVDAGTPPSDEIRALRERVMAALAQVDARLMIDTVFIDYAAALIRNSYNVSDDDLSMLLLTGTGWHAPMLDLICGEEWFEEWAKHRMTAAQPFVEAQSPRSQPRPGQRAGKRPGLLARIRAALKGGERPWTR